jgi:hypothetical protein
MLAAAIIVPVAEKEVVSTLRSSTWSKLWSTYSMLTSVWALVRSVRRISLLPVRYLSSQMRQVVFTGLVVVGRRVG